MPLLFCGKTNLADMKALAQLAEEGLLAQPRFLPPPFADPHALAVLLRRTGFWHRLTPQRVRADYAGLF